MKDYRDQCILKDDHSFALLRGLFNCVVFVQDKMKCDNIEQLIFLLVIPIENPFQF